METNSPHPFITLGARPRIKDKRDYKIESFKGSTAPTPPSYQSIVSTIYMQAKYPTCGGHAPAPAANIIFNTITSPKYIWDEIKENDGIDPTDGTTMDAIFKTWKNSGICHISLLPDNLGVSLTDYTNPANITNVMITDAQNRKISNYAFTDKPTIQQIKDAIYQYKAVILLVDCGDGWYTNSQGQTSWAEADVLPLKLGNFIDGHFICATGFDEKYIYFANSWSTAWGKNGIGYFNESYIAHVREMGVPIVNQLSTNPNSIVNQEPQKYIFNSDINYGDTSADVHQLQVRLGVPVSLTFTSGHYGFLTLIAVVRFEIMNKLPITSIVTEQMRSLLNT